MGLLSAGAKGGKKAVESADNLFDLMFLHNTNSDKLARQLEIGGMPSPSIAVTKKDIPFDNFGDITLVGNPSSFDPKIKANVLYDADAYTVRAPDPVRFSKKNAYSKFDDDYADIDVRDKQNISDALHELSYKSRASGRDYSEILDTYEYGTAPLVKFAKERGIKIEKDKYGGYSNYSMQSIRNKYAEDYSNWSKDQIDSYLQPDLYFVSNPNYDRYTGRPIFKEYTSDNATRWMNKQGGRGAESGTLGGTGKIRAMHTGQIKSLDQARGTKAALQPKDAIEAFKKANEDEFFSISDDLRKYYKYDANSFGFLEEVSDMMQIAPRKGIDNALKEIGFDDVPDKLKSKIKTYQENLANAPTQYFESKPRRTVPISSEEWAGAIIPQNTSPATRSLLDRAGIKMQEYTDEASRTAARNKFKSEMFSNPYATMGAPVAGSGLLALGLTPDEARAAQIAATDTRDIGSIQAARNPRLQRAAGLLGSIDTPIGSLFESTPNVLNRWAYGEEADAMDKLGMALELMP